MSSAPQCPVFQATHRDLQAKTFAQFVEEHELDFEGAGVCKIVPPRGWRPRKEGYSGVNFTIDKPIRQHATGKQGLYRTLLMEDKSLTLRQFKLMAEDPFNAPPKGADAETLERKYWKNVALNPPLYGADVPGSLFDEDVKGWNLSKLDSLLSRTMAQHSVAIPGVNSPYLYIGSWRSTFAWHTEDLDLHSVNYLHFGAGKTWYVVPPAHRPRFERLMTGMLPDLFRVCPEFLRHKELVVSPSLLQAHNIPVVRVLQNPGEFVVTYPGAYHCGFNQGYNCAESVNFATKTWVDIGAVAGSCECQQDTVRIDMRMFAEHMSPDLREEWLASDSLDSDFEESKDSDSEASEGSESQASDSSGASDSGQAASESGACSEEAGAAGLEDSDGVGSAPGAGSEEEEGGEAAASVAAAGGSERERAPGHRWPLASRQGGGEGRKRSAVAAAAGKGGGSSAAPPSKRRRAPRQCQRQQTEKGEEQARGRAGGSASGQGREAAGAAACKQTRPWSQQQQQQQQQRSRPRAQRPPPTAAAGAGQSPVRAAAGGDSVQARRPRGQLRRPGATSGLAASNSAGHRGAEARALRLQRRQQLRGDTPRDERRRRREALQKLQEQEQQEKEGAEEGAGGSGQGRHAGDTAGQASTAAALLQRAAGSPVAAATAVAAAAGSGGGAAGEVSSGGLGRVSAGGGPPAEAASSRGSGRRLLSAVSSILPHLKRAQ